MFKVNLGAFLWCFYCCFSSMRPFMLGAIFSFTLMPDQRYSTRGMYICLSIMYHNFKLIHEKKVSLKVWLRNASKYGIAFVVKYYFVYNCFCFGPVMVPIVGYSCVFLMIFWNGKSFWIKWYPTSAQILCLQDALISKTNLITNLHISMPFINKNRYFRNKLSF